MLKSFFNISLATTALAAFGTLSAGFLPFNSSVVQPQQMVMHVEQAYWIDENNTKYPLLQAPMDIDVIEDQFVDLTPALTYARSENITPVKLVVEAKRYFEMRAATYLPELKTPAHTSAEFPDISFGEISHISLAAQTKGSPTTQTCWLPVCGFVDEQIGTIDVTPGQDGTIYYTLDVSSLDESCDQLRLFISGSFAEFGTYINSYPIIVIPHLPILKIES